tara:strand:+ start:848 stop:1063 length:216 start_codon:yes stop_codon:yes gene_type:complete
MELTNKPKGESMTLKMERRYIYGTGGYGWKSICECEIAKRKEYRFGAFNPSVSIRNVNRQRGGHETWGTQR